MVFGTELNSLIIEQVSIIIALLGIITYYFGKIISDTRPQKEVRSVSYIEGFYFLVIFVVLPLLIVYYISYQTSFIIFLKPYWWLSLLIEYALVYFLYLKHSSFIIHLYELEKYFQKIYKRKVNEVLKNKIKLNKKGLTSKTMTWFQKFMYKKISNQGLFIISTFLIFTTYIVFTANPSILYVSVSGISLLLGLSLLAILYGYYTAQFPYVTIILKNGKMKSGKMIKYDGEFFIVIDRELKYSFNKDEVLWIESPILFTKEKIK